MEQLGDDAEVAAKVALCPLWDAFAALESWSADIVERAMARHTQAMRTFLGSEELGSLTLTKANWMRPSENSSTRSSSSPSGLCQRVVEHVCVCVAISAGPGAEA